MTPLFLLALSSSSTQIAAKPAPLDPTIAYLGRLAGSWDGVATAGKESFKCHFVFAWNDDHRGFHGDGFLGTDTPNPIHSISLFGYDQAAKAMYYLDTHGSDTVYTGHGHLKDGKAFLEFGNLGAKKIEFESTEWFKDDDHYAADIRQAGHAGEPPMIHVELTRAPA